MFLLVDRFKLYAARLAPVAHTGGTTEAQRQGGARRILNKDQGMMKEEVEKMFNTQFSTLNAHRKVSRKGAKRKRRKES